MSNLLILSLFDLTGNMVKPWLDQGHKAIIVDTQHLSGVDWCSQIAHDFFKVGYTFEETPDSGYLFVKKFEWLFKAHGKPDIIFGFPPCTDLAVSGARWFKDKEARNPGFQDKAMNLVRAVEFIANYFGIPYMVENPVSVISSQWRAPDGLFHPYEFTGYCLEDNYTKKTCLWTGNGFKIPEPFMDKNVETAMSLVSLWYGKKITHKQLRDTITSPYIGSQSTQLERSMVLKYYPDNRIHWAGPSEERANLRSATPMGFARGVYESNN